MQQWNENEEMTPIAAVVITCILSLPYRSREKLEVEE